MSIDPSTLTDEMKAYIDQQRTQASKTAYDNAYKKLQSDDEFISNIKSQLEEQARLSGEEKLKLEREKLDDERKKLKVEKNMFDSKSYLMNNGLPEEHVNNFLGFLVSEDSEKTKNNLESFVNSYKTTLESQVTKVKEDLLHNIDKPNQGGNGGNSDSAKLKQDFENAKKMGNQVEMSRITRMASLLNIQL